MEGLVLLASFIVTVALLWRRTTVRTSFFIGFVVAVVIAMLLADVLNGRSSTDVAFCSNKYGEDSGDVELFIDLYGDQYGLYAEEPCKHLTDLANPYGGFNNFQEAHRTGMSLDQYEEVLNHRKLKAEALEEEQRRLQQVLQAEEATKAAEDKRKGFHCLSNWDGSSPSIERELKKRMHDPDSYEHVETLVTPEHNGLHEYAVTYRASNGFGALRLYKVGGEFRNEGCLVVSMNREDL